MVWNRCLDKAANCLLLTALVCLCAQAASAQTGSSEVWKDKETGLTWTAKDNGSSVNLGQAGDYCTGLKTGGFSDWRLPTIDELTSLYDKSLKKMYKTKGSVELSDSCTLSSSTNPSGDVWSFCFSYGGRTLNRASGHGSAGRVLCVRKSE
jgi:hypothetical protein